MFKPINYDFNGEVERWRVGELERKTRTLNAATKTPRTPRKIKKNFWF